MQLYDIARRKPYAWLNSFIKGCRKTPNQLRNVNGFNVLSEGDMRSGKTHLLDVLMELAIDNFGTKFYIINVDSILILKERLKMLMPNPQNRNGKAYKIIVLVPITEHMPNRLPSFFLPYSVPVNGLDKYALQSVFGLGSYDQYAKQYAKKRRSSMSYVELKRGIRETSSGTERDKIEREITESGFFGKRYLSTKRESVSETKFQRAFEIFDKLGVVNNANFPLSLDKVLSSLINDNSHMVILYTGFEEDEWIRNFCKINFVETLRNVISRQKKMSFRNVVLLPELQDFCKPEFSKSHVEMDFIINAFVKEIMFKGGHYNIDCWGDTKPYSMDKNIRKLFNVQFVTRISSNDVLGEIIKFTFHDGKDLMNYFNNGYYIRTHGFIDVRKNKIPVWRTEHRTYTYGYRLFCKRKSSDDEPLIDNVDFSFFTNELKFEMRDIFPIKQAFADARLRSEKKEIERRIDHIIHMRQENLKASDEKKERIDARVEIIRFLDKELEEHGAEYVASKFAEWSNDWAKEYGTTKRTIERWTEKWRKDSLE